MSAFVEMLPVVVAAWLVLVGLYGIVTTRDLLHAVLCTSLVHSGAWLLLVGVGYGAGTTAPVVDDDLAEGAVLADPLVQALTVTDIVVGVAVSALLLACVVRVQRRFGSLDPSELDVLRG
ncbi:NADH-quinone oxidoreductase subunit K [Egicoccus sp. AB-alg6-2]|uniref:NADH-quinone oxidoreductase subunit K n=1 Tax=Egicoccus sp. AB-alg6-2 TaxID=3242692 RepID=UPI00359E4560